MIWHKLSEEKPSENGVYIVFPGWEKVRWKDNYFDMNPGDIPYLKRVQPTHWMYLPVGPNGEIIPHE